MSASIDLLWQNLLPMGDAQNQNAVKTVTAAADMSGTDFGWLTIVEGTTAIATITAPTTGWATIVLVFTNANPGGVTTGGNIQAAVDPAQYAPIIGVYSPIAAKWYFGKLALG